MQLEKNLRNLARNWVLEKTIRFKTTKKGLKMLNSAFLYSFQSNKEAENQMFKISLLSTGCLHLN